MHLRIEWWGKSSKAAHFLVHRHFSERDSWGLGLRLDFGLSWDEGQKITGWVAAIIFPTVNILTLKKIKRIHSLTQFLTYSEKEKK